MTGGRGDRSFGGMNTTPSISRLFLLVAATLSGALLASASASAAEYSFTNGSAITTPSQGQATPAASRLYVGGVRGPVTDIEVQLNGVTHPRPRDLDVLLVAPDGTRSIVMSDACGSVAMSNRTLVLKGDGFLIPEMPETLACPSTYYLATNHLFPDSWPASPGNNFSLLRSFRRKALNEDWRLLVVDDEAGSSGTIARGWTLRFTTGPVDTLVPGTSTRGAGDPYPATKAIPASDRVISDVDVSVPGVAHDRPDDLDLLLVGPQGQKALLMSDACGTVQITSDFTFDDEAKAAPSDEFDDAVCHGRVKPVDHDKGDELPAPAPDGPYGSSLEAFDGSAPGGDWKLYAADDADDYEGYLLQRFDLTIETRAKAALEFAQGSVQVAEGVRQALTIRRSAAGGLGAGAVTVSTADGTGTAGADFTPLSTRVRFDRDQRQKTVLLDARADGKAEPAETYAVSLSNPAGDAALGTRTRANVTIPASAAGNRGSGANANRCAGRPATIVGTSGRDSIRGTRRADVIVALAGNDAVKGGGGNDLVCAGGGNDRVAGDAGRDRLDGGAGKDRLAGGTGRDTCLGGKGRDRARCERTNSV